MSDAEMRGWERRRQRGYKPFRRYIGFIFAAVYAAGLLILSLLIWLNVVPTDPLPALVWSAYGGFLVMPIFLSWALSPMMWQLQEMMYYATLQDQRETPESDQPES